MKDNKKLDEKFTNYPKNKTSTRFLKEDHDESDDSKPFKGATVDLEMMI